MNTEENNRLITTTMSEFKITKGELSIPHFANNDIECNCSFVLHNETPICTATFHWKKDDSLENSEYPEKEEAIGNSKLYVDSHNTYQKCEKLPSQLLAENEKLIKAFKRLMPNMQGYGYEYHKSNNWFEFSFKEEIELLKYLEQTQQLTDK